MMAKKKRETPQREALPYPDSDLPPQLQRTIALKLSGEPVNGPLDTTDKEKMEEAIRQLFAPDEPPAEE